MVRAGVTLGEVCHEHAYWLRSFARWQSLLLKRIVLDRQWSQKMRDFIIAALLTQPAIAILHAKAEGSYHHGTRAVDARWWLADAIEAHLLDMPVPPLPPSKRRGWKQKPTK